MTKKELEAKVRRLVRASNWLTGCGAEFEPDARDINGDGSVPPFWYRSKFVRKAGLKWDRKKLRYV